VSEQLLNGTSAHYQQCGVVLSNYKNNFSKVSKKERLKCPKMTMRKHYKSCGKSHGNERLKRKALRQLWKTDIEGVDMTCWGSLFQVRAAATGRARLPIGLNTIRIIQMKSIRRMNKLNYTRQ